MKKELLAGALLLVLIGLCAWNLRYLTRMCTQLDDAVAQLSELGFKHLVYTDIARDGMQTGIDVAAYRHVAEVAGFPVVASGGISTLDDIRALAAVGEGAIEGAITGRALYEGNFTLVQALAAARGEE